MLRVVTYKYPPFSTSHPFRTPTSYPVLSLIPPIPLSHFSWASHQPPLHDVITPYIGRSRPSDKGGPSHPNPEISGGGWAASKFFFGPLGLIAVKKKGGLGPAGPSPGSTTAISLAFNSSVVVLANSQTTSPYLSEHHFLALFRAHLTVST